MLTRNPKAKVQGDDPFAIFDQVIDRLSAEQSLKSVVREFFERIEHALTERGARFEHVAIALIQAGKVPEPADAAGMKKLASTIKKYTQDLRLEQKAELKRLMGAGCTFQAACAEIGADPKRLRARIEEASRLRSRPLDADLVLPPEEDDRPAPRAARPTAERRPAPTANVDTRWAERTPPASTAAARGRTRTPAPSVDTDDEDEGRRHGASVDMDDVPDPEDFDFGVPEEEPAPAPGAAPRIAEKPTPAPRATAPKAAEKPARTVRVEAKPTNSSFDPDAATVSDFMKPYRPEPRARRVETAAA